MKVIALLDQTELELLGNYLDNAEYTIITLCENPRNTALISALENIRKVRQLIDTSHAKTEIQQRAAPELRE